ncbi:class I SAM-dependent methyltransferase [Prochlorococcus sp. MIT 0601]|uniref:class I SAM-dependent methyltransferase n=2 Tax=Prochlorococcus TaxID=1218 RepID=UPI000533A2B4|nr:class I SAM-dependent methyltransferase [Prochlorococcus sp. MIT 0601]KGG12100.1 hypothetical protein EV05_1303 [Prochlorococcus sp. MIT 0601]
MSFIRKNSNARILIKESGMMAFKLLKLIKNPLKIINLIKLEYLEFRCNTNKRIDSQTKIYKELGLQRDKSIKHLNVILKQLGLNKYDEDYGMYSEHLIIFAGIALEKKNIDSVLEIGTYDAISTTILSALFENSKIYTIDLKNNDPIYKQTYSREDSEIRNRFNIARDKIIASRNNIEFIQMNSLAIMQTTLRKKKFDLIWIDGAHGYPFVCSDIMNSIALAHQSTIIMCDDIWESVDKSDQIYKSIASWETLNCLKYAELIDLYFFLKRVGKIHLNNKKFIAYFKLKDLSTI